MASVTLSGLAELNKAFHELTEEMQKKTAGRATNKAAQVIRKAAVQKAPEAPSNISPEVPPGNLKANIRVKRLSPNESNFTSESIVFVRGGAKAHYASRYGSIQEFGSVKQGPENAFMRPAFDTEKERAVKEMADAIADDIKKANRK